MSEKLAPTNDPALEEVRNQFEIWREAKKGNDRIPESLWQAAVDLTKTHTPNKIAKTLGLNCMRFKSRVNASEAALPINKEASGILDPALETVRLQFEKWRAGKGANERIPVELWEAAVNLAETLSLGKITETLRLCYSRLKKRVEAAEALRLMEKGSVSAADSALEDVRIQFETWRESKKGHELIPEDLWLAAADLARTHSIGKVARTLGLKITGLRKRLDSVESVRPMEKESAPATNPTLEEVRIQVETWREDRKCNEPFPEDLWQAAVDLARSHSPENVAPALGLNTARLKKRVSAAEVRLPANKDPAAHTDPALEEVRNQFETWREARKRRERIPEDLWRAAVDLTKTRTPNKIAQVLGLNCTKLKNRANCAEVALPEPEEPSPTFIELDFGPPAISSGCVIEMEDRSGRKMKIHLNGQEGFDPAEICNTFWRNHV